MMMEYKNGNEGFSYTYSAKQQEELKKIRQKYMPPEEDKMVQLRRLDASVTQKGTTVALIVGIIGTMMLGIGMCCAMIWQGAWFIPGIAIGVAGIVLVSLAYPLYLRVVKKARAKVAPEIMRLTDELMK